MWFWFHCNIMHRTENMQLQSFCPKSLGAVVVWCLRPWFKPHPRISSWKPSPSKNSISNGSESSSGSQLESKLVFNSVAFTASSIHHPRYTSLKKLKHGHFKWISRIKHLPEILCHYFIFGSSASVCKQS